MHDMVLRRTFWSSNLHGERVDRFKTSVRDNSVTIEAMQQPKIGSLHGLIVGQSRGKWSPLHTSAFGLISILQSSEVSGGL